MGNVTIQIVVHIAEAKLNDNSTHLLKHADEMRHETVWLESFKVYSRDFKRKISESLFINELELECSEDDSLMSINRCQYNLVSISLTFVVQLINRSLRLITCNYFLKIVDRFPLKY